MIEDWSKAVRAEIDRRVLLKGESFDGCKVVAGKKGRAHKDQGEAEALALQRRPAADPRAALRPEAEDPHPGMEKALKTSPATWAKLQKLIDQAEGKPAVVRTSRPTPGHLSPRRLAEDFDDLTQENNPRPEGYARAVTATPSDRRPRAYGNSRKGRLAFPAIWAPTSPTTAPRSSARLMFDPTPTGARRASS
jgi:hypothetical protein